MISFNKRLAELRRDKKLSQEELASSIGVHANILGRYERDEAKPSIEVASKLADALDVSLDYLVGKSNTLVDKDIASKILTIQKLPNTDKEHILFTLDAMLRDAKARLAYSI